MKRLTKAQRSELEDYVEGYTRRAVIGVWFPLVTAIRAALDELEMHRAAEKIRKAKK